MIKLLKPFFLILSICFLLWLSLAFTSAAITISSLIFIGLIIKQTSYKQSIDRIVAYFCESFLVLLVSPVLILKNIINLFSYIKDHFNISALNTTLIILISAAFLFAPIILSQTLNAILWYGIIAAISLIISINDGKDHLEQTENNTSFFLGFVLSVSLVILGLIPNFITIIALVFFNLSALLISSKNLEPLFNTCNEISSNVFGTQATTCKDLTLSKLLQEANALINDFKPN
jgi:hypothetical protein